MVVSLAIILLLVETNKDACKDETTLHIDPFKTLAWWIEQLGPSWFRILAWASWTPAIALAPTTQRSKHRSSFVPTSLSPLPYASTFPFVSQQPPCQWHCGPDLRRRESGLQHQRLRMMRKRRTIPWAWLQEIAEMLSRPLELRTRNQKGV